MRRAVGFCLSRLQEPPLFSRLQDGNFSRLHPPTRGALFPPLEFVFLPRSSPACPHYAPAIGNRHLGCPRSQNSAFFLLHNLVLSHLTPSAASFSKFGLRTASNSAHSRSVSNLGVKDLGFKATGGHSVLTCFKIICRFIVDGFLDEWCAQAHCAFWILQFE